MQRGEQEDAASSLQALIPQEGELSAGDSSDPEPWHLIRALGPGPRDGLKVQL